MRGALSKLAYRAEDTYNSTFFFKQLRSIHDMASSSDYRDYVFKDGRFVGAFDEMYRNSGEVPWHQDRNAFGVFSDLDIAILRHFQRGYGFRSVCDVGCGLGYMSERIRSEVGSNGSGLSVHGIDISATAVAEASRRFPAITFETADPLRSDLSHLAGRFDLVFAKEVVWYVLEGIERFFDVLASLSNRFIYVSQSFPEVEDYVGKSTFPNAQALEDFVARRHRILYSVVERDSNYHYRELIHIVAEKAHTTAPVRETHGRT
jgi:SAM-dependent methyltransferase